MRRHYSKRVRLMWVFLGGCLIFGRNWRFWSRAREIIKIHQKSHVRVVCCHSHEYCWSRDIGGRQFHGWSAVCYSFLVDDRPKGNNRDGKEIRSTFILIDEHHCMLLSPKQRSSESQAIECQGRYASFVTKSQQWYKKLVYNVQRTINPSPTSPSRHPFPSFSSN